MTELKGEVLGDINEIFFGDLSQPQVQESKEVVISPDLVKKDNKEENKINTNNENLHVPSDKTIIIKNDIEEEEVRYNLDKLEELRLSKFLVKDMKYVYARTGEEVLVKERMQLHNGQYLYNVIFKNNKAIIHPRKMFIGPEKVFYPVQFYKQYIEYLIQKKLEEFESEIFDLIKSNKLQETEDNQYLELILEEGILVTEDLKIIDDTFIPIYKIFDLDYKIMFLKYVICNNNRIVALIFEDQWL